MIEQQFPHYNNNSSTIVWILSANSSCISTQVPIEFIQGFAEPGFVTPNNNLKKILNHELLIEDLYC
jgi:hypothetical protein